MFLICLCLVPTISYNDILFGPIRVSLSTPVNERAQ